MENTNTTGSIKAKKDDVWFLVGKVFPDYKGRKFTIRAVENVTLYDLNWGGGSRNQYRAVHLEDGRVSAPGFAQGEVAPWNNQAEGAVVPMKTGWALVEHSIFQGKDCGITIYVGPENMAKLLPCKCAEGSCEYPKCSEGLKEAK